MKYVDGNLLDMAEQGSFDIIVHGANCQNTMGSGIAKQIKERYPKAYMIDQLTQKGDFRKLGQFTQAHVDGFRHNTDPTIRTIGRGYSFTIINAYTQLHYGRGFQHVCYDALLRVFTQIKLLYDMNPQAPCKIGIPKIGAGLGGGDWGKIEEIIDSVGFSDLTCVVYGEEK